MLLGVVSVVWACRHDVRPEQTVINNTDSLLCYYQGGPLQDFCPEIQPHGRVTFAAECRGGEQQLAIVLTAGPGGPEIYNAAASCNEWIRSGGRIIVEESDNELAVEDSLPDVTPAP